MDAQISVPEGAHLGGMADIEECQPDRNRQASRSTHDRPRYRESPARPAQLRAANRTRPLDRTLPRARGPLPEPEHPRH